MPLKTGIAAMAIALVFAGAVFSFASRGPDEPVAAKAATQDTSEPLKRSDPGVEPWKEPTVAPREAVKAETEPEPEPPPEPKEERPAPEPELDPKPAPPEPEVKTTYEPKPAPEPEPVEEPAPVPPEEDPEPAEKPEPYTLPDGAVMALSVDALGLRDVPVLDGIDARALKHGVGHDPGTSLPWNDGPHKNVYVAGHRVGFPGTASDRVFDELGDLGRGDGVVLRGEDGKKYRYEVTESFVASPEDSWVMDRLRNKDMVTLQTCVGPNFSERLIVRAERV